MTNVQIILLESLRLMDEGILESSGQAMTIDEKMVDIPEEIHTYEGWKRLGYQVTRGQKALAQFPIWKHTSKKVENEETGEEEDKSNMFMKTASFFKTSQVEKVVNTNAR